MQLEAAHVPGETSLTDLTSQGESQVMLKQKPSLQPKPSVRTLRTHQHVHERKARARALWIINRQSPGFLAAFETA